MGIQKMEINCYILLVVSQLQTKRKGTMDRAFPTFKIFFIEEDNYVWKAFDDFYSYDKSQYKRAKKNLIIT